MVKVLIVEHSAVIRQKLSEALSRDPDLEVLAASTALAARDKIVTHSPDVVTLALDMPRAQSVSFLRKIMQYHPLPIVVLSSRTSAGSDLAIEALNAGAVEILHKPDDTHDFSALVPVLIERIKGSASIYVGQHAASPRVTANSCDRKIELTQVTDQVIAIGASTGGTVAVELILKAMPTQIPPLLVTQHMPPVFTASFASRLNKECTIDVREARNGDVVCPGLALIAPGGYHMTLNRVHGAYEVSTSQEPPVNQHRPSVDVMFHSVAEAASKRAIGVILTGMGGDGAKGLLKMKEAGAATIAQNAASCVVFGMPKVAIELGGVDHVLDLKAIPNRVLSLVEQRSRR